ncbi:MAG TPA: hypothetical protein VL995_11105 [Cellvibrio sp.]|nr:hypothetical protein [Cellvibrio sp.]
MKKYKWIFAVVLLVLIACQASANNTTLWKQDGSVTSANGKKIQLEIQGIYDSLEYNGINFLVGFKIDKEGNNSLYIVKIPNDLSSAQYWAFESIHNDIFIHKETVHVITMNGEVYELKDGKWNLTNKQFPRESQIVYSDHKDNLIVCHPASMEKTGDHNSGCFSTANNWKLGFIWFNIVPKVCNGQLYIVEENNSGKVFKQVDLKSGKVMKSELLKNVPDDICKLK